MEKSEDLKIELHATEERLLSELRDLRRSARSSEQGTQMAEVQLTIGQRIADTVAATMGSWRFIIIQSVMLMFWIALNVTAYVQRWDWTAISLSESLTSPLACSAARRASSAKPR